MNMVILSGRLTRDPEVRASSASSVVHATVAVDSWNSATKTREGEFFNVVVFGQQAEFLAKYGGKGREITVSGRLHNNQWADKATGEKRSRTEIIASQVQLHGKNEPRAEEMNDGGLMF